MIDEKKLIEEIEYMIGMLPTYYINKKDEENAYLDAINRVLSVVKRQPKVGEWIPVEEGLPKQAGYACLATIQNKFGQIKIAKVFTHYGTGIFWLCNESDIDLNVWEVIAWMLLPEPYQGEEKTK